MLGSPRARVHFTSAAAQRTAAKHCSTALLQPHASLEVTVTSCCDRRCALRARHDTNRQQSCGRRPQPCYANVSSTGDPHQHQPMKPQTRRPSPRPALRPCLLAPGTQPSRPAVLHLPTKPTEPCQVHKHACSTQATMQRTVAGPTFSITHPVHPSPQRHHYQ